MKFVPVRDRKNKLTLFAIVDDRDFEKVSRVTWKLVKGGYAGRKIYAGYRSGFKKSGRRREKRRTLRMHRFILGLAIGNPIEVDHRNGYGLDNRRENLRLITQRGNAQNRKKHRWRRTSQRQSKYRGVWWVPSTKKWKAQVTVRGKIHVLGYFKEETKAGRAAFLFREKHMPYALSSREGNEWPQE